MRSKVNNFELEHGERPTKLSNCKIEKVEKMKTKCKLIQTILKK